MVGNVNRISEPPTWLHTLAALNTTTFREIVMSGRNCTECDTPFPVRLGPGRYPRLCLACKNKPKLTFAKACKHCGIEFTTKYGNKEYCSGTCQDRYLREAGKSEIAECRLCGSPFAFKPGHDQQGVFCSRECVGLNIRLVGRAEAKIVYQLPDPRDEVVRRCRLCKEELATNTNPNRRYCTSCRLIRHSTKGTLTTCSMCGKQCVSFAVKSRPYCSTECRDNDPYYNRKVVKRALRLKVFERDKWTCQICHEEIDPTRHWSEPDGKSIDHIIPRSKGGSNHIDNLQAAHRKCNSSKTNNVTALF